MLTGTVRDESVDVVGIQTFDINALVQNDAMNRRHESGGARVRVLLLLVAISIWMLAACSGLVNESPSVIRGTLVLDTKPNPLLARPLGGDDYEMAFDIIMREQGGVDTRIESFTVEALAIGGLVVRKESHSASFITSRGYPAEVPAGQYRQFNFVKRWKLPSEVLLAGASVRVTAHTIDANGSRNVTMFRADVHRAAR